MAATSAPQPTPEKSSGKFARIFQVLVTIGIWTAAVFVSAGTIHWARGWFCFAVYITGITIAGVLVRMKNPVLLQERAKWRRKDTKPFDKIFLRTFLPLTFVQPAVAGFDAVRFRWSSMPFATVYAGLVIFAISMSMVTWSMVVNPFAESTVRIQTDRGQHVITSGPYRIVRHPMYVGAMTMYFGTALIFGSWWAMGVALIIASLFVWRTAMEDRTLRNELTGYEDFAAVTRYRLLPGIW